MNLQMNLSLMQGYKSGSQIAKALTESWVASESYCPACLNSLSQAAANEKVLDFTCKHCNFDYELKSKKGAFGKKINDGAYDAMMMRLAAIHSPHFFFLNYTQEYKVKNFIAVPSYFVQSSAIEKRKPLSPFAKRAGWIGCNIITSEIPEVGKIKIIDDFNVVDREEVKCKWHQTRFLEAPETAESKGWTLDVLNKIESLNIKDFTLKEIYQFENEFAIKHPKNSHVKEKIRQQLQILRDAGIVDFKGRGSYRLLV